jgi:hypothetical protein
MCKITLGYKILKKAAAIKVYPTCSSPDKINTWQIDLRSFNHKTGYTNIIQSNDWFAPECLAAAIRHPYF